MKWIIFVLISFQIYATPSNTIESVSIIIPDDVARDYQLFVGKKKIEDIIHYRSPHSRRDVVEVVLFLKAMRAAGHQGPFEIKTAQTSERIRRDLAQGVVLAAATSDWKNSIESAKLWYSAPLINNKEFVVGIYGTHRDRLNKIKTLGQLRKLRFVSNPSWANDWQTLMSMQIEQLLQTGSWPNMLQMIKYARADVTLAPFSSHPQLLIVQDGISLSPINGITVGINGSRHFAISPKYPKSGHFRQLLDQGIEKLRKSGELQKAYRESGFFNSKVKNWVMINQ